MNESVMDNPNAIYTGVVEGLAYGGLGIVRHSGLVVFIPFSAPGDTVSFKIIKKKRSYAEGQIVEIIEASPLRIVPKCSHFRVCGGCQLQHLSYPTQLAHKQQVVADALERIGGIHGFPVLPVIPTEDIWAYRRHISLNSRSEDGKGYDIGYIAADHSSFLPINECPIFSEEKDRIFLHLRDVFARLNTSQEGEGRGILIKQEGGSFLGYFFFSVIPSNAEEIFAVLLQKSSLFRGVILASPETNHHLGETSAHLSVEGLVIQFTPKSFVQNHPGQSLAIYRQLIQIVQECEAKKIIDLYCGIGISSLLLARTGCEVTGVENNKEAVKNAVQNARQNDIGSVRFIEADAGRVLERLLVERKPDLVIVNPPRIGLDPRVVNALVLHGPRTIVYISCKPSTLARDLRLLCHKRYQLTSCQPYDMFPQTGHVETVAVLQSL
jgi:23S rRNA (uracil1939-C5)-methyltransferase